MIIQPYKYEQLNIAETISLSTLCLLTLLNTFWAFADEVDISKNENFMLIGQIFIYIELLILLLPFIIILTFILSILIKICIFKQFICKQD